MSEYGRTMSARSERNPEGLNDAGLTDEEMAWMGVTARIAREDLWWDGLQGDEILNNAYGVPHYDVRQVANFILSYLNFDGRVLDLGCGPGRLGHELAHRNPHGTVYGVDVSPQMIRLSRTHAPTNWLATVSDGETVPSGPFTGAYSVTVFQHLEHHVVQAYVKQVYDALVAGGRFLFTYAVGSEDTFLSHQTSHELVEDWLANAGFNGKLLDTPHVHPRWNWALGEK